MPNTSTSSPVSMSASTQAEAVRSVALAGNPNSGKSAFFNALTGSYQRIANFPGVTVEKKEGFLKTDTGRISVIDLPGTYSLETDSPDERIAQNILLGLQSGAAKPDVVAVVVDINHLERSLFLLSQLMEFGLKLVLCLNMVDIAKKRGLNVDIDKLSELLGIPVIQTVATRGEGREQLLNLLTTHQWKKSRRPFSLPEELENARTLIARQLILEGVVRQEQADFWAGKVLTGRWRTFEGSLAQRVGGAAIRHRNKSTNLSESEYSEADIQTRYRWIESVCQQVIKNPGKTTSVSDRIDAIALHPIIGPVLFAGVMALLFQAVFKWATPFMDLIDAGIGMLSTLVTSNLPEGILRAVLVEGVLGGVGSVIIFIPQIILLFFGIGILEATGYMARAAFLIDRLMVRSGLTGKSFIPLLTSFACAIPGIMATRTIKSEKDRLATMLVAPLMTCSARLPVYALLIAAFIPSTSVLGFGLKGLVLFGLYFLGVLGAVIVARVMRKTILRGQQAAFVLELPDYKVPSMKNIARFLWNRTKLFLTKAGKVILLASVVLWFLASFPKNQSLENTLIAQGASANEIQGALLEQSYAGRIGKLIEPAITPLGYDWKVGVGLLASFAAREVFVATMGTIYNISDADEDSVALKSAIQSDRHAITGKTLFSIPMVLGLLVFFVYAMQCVSTVAVLKRETNSWKWPLFAIGYTYLLAYTLAFVTYRVASFFA